MAKKLHLVFGGELIDPSETAFRDPDNLDIIGIFSDHEAAVDAWRGAAQRTVDNAHMRYFIAHIHRLRDEGIADSLTEQLGA